MKNGNLSISAIALVISLVCAVVVFRQDKGGPVITVRDSEGKVSLKEFRCGDGEYLAGFTEMQEPICRRLPQDKVAVNFTNQEQLAKFVGGWTVGEICKFRNNSDILIDQCKEENFDSVSECIGEVGPQVINVSATKKVFIPTPCLRHLDRCYMKNQRAEDTQRIYMTCQAYKILTMGK